MLEDTIEMNKKAKEEKQKKKSCLETIARVEEASSG